MSPLEPLVVDPLTYDKREALATAVTYVERFLSGNGFERPSSLITELPPATPKNGWRRNGWYDFDSMVMFVNLKRSRPPVKVPGFSWSFTGFKADLTAPGILAHETGHHIHNCLNRRHGRSRAREILGLIRRCSTSEPNVSGYEPNDYEVWAEALRLFIINPELLREGRSVRWAMLTGELGLKPPHQVPWREVLLHAHPKLIAAGEAWIKKAQ